MITKQNSTNYVILGLDPRIQATQTFKYLLKYLFIILLSIELVACSNESNDSKNNIENHVMVVSVSSDGQYVLTTNTNKHAYLWDIKNQSYKQLDTEFPINIYSAYFIQDTNTFMYQNNDTNQVIIQNTKGKIIKKIDVNFPVYGQAITSDLKTWIGNDEKFRLFIKKDGKLKKILYHWCGPDYKNEGKKPPKGSYYTCKQFSGQLPNLNLSPDENYFTSNDGLNTLFIWDTKTGNLIKDISKNTGQTTNAIPPNGQYVVTGDSNGHAVIYNFGNENIKTFSWSWGKDITNKSIKNWQRNNTPDALTSINYITDDLIVTTSHGIPKPFLFIATYKPFNITSEEGYGVKYLVNNAINFLPLVKHPNAQYPADNGLYPQTQSFLPVVDTSPSAHMLVMAQANGGGIMVYQYHPEDQSLALIWAPTLKDE